MTFLPISMVSWSGILVKRVVTLKGTRNFQEYFTFLIWETKEKVSLQGERRSQRKRARLWLKSAYRWNN